MPLLLADIEWSQGVEDAWRSVASFIPDFLGFCLILAVGWIVARTVSRVLDRVLERSGFDRAVERGGVRAALARSRYDASDVVSRLVFYGLMLLVLQLAFGVFGENPVSDLIAATVAFLPKLFVAIVIFVVATAIGAAVRDLVANALAGLPYGRTLGTVASATVVVLGAFMALDQLDIAPAIVTALFYAVLAVVAGSAIVAIGGGGIQPMRARWERALTRWDEESPRLRGELDGARARARAQATAPQGTADVTAAGAAGATAAGAAAGAGAGAGEIDLRDRTPAGTGRAVDQDTLMGVPTPAAAAGGGAGPATAPGGETAGGVRPATTQERIRAEIRTEADTLP